MRLRHGLVLALLACAACSSGSTAPPIDGTGGVDLAMAPPDAAAGDLAASFRVVNGCAQGDYVDFTQGQFPTIKFPVDATPAQYQPRCVKVKPFTTVSWSGGFGFHPLAASGGDDPNPVNGMPAVTFPKTGIFGFHCSRHPVVMSGAVWVVP